MLRKQRRRGASAELRAWAEQLGTPARTPMFDAVLKRSNAPNSRIGTGAIASVLLHAALLASVLWISTRPQFTKNARDLAVKFVVPPPPAPPPPPQSKRTAEIRERKSVRKPDTIVQPREISKEKPPEAEPEQAPDVGVEGGAEGGVVGGVIGGLVGGVEGGVIGGQPPAKRIEIDESNIKLLKIAGPTPQYTDKALENGVEGTMVVKCVVAADGAVNGCRVLKSLPFMDRAAIDALEKWRFRPYTVDNKPVDVDYTFRLKLTLGQ